MVLHLSYAEGGFGVPFNCVTKDAAFYTTTSRFVSWMGAFDESSVSNAGVVAIPSQFKVTHQIQCY
jgi:hypothetical protein